MKLCKDEGRSSVDWHYQITCRNHRRNRLLRQLRRPVAPTIASCTRCINLPSECQKWRAGPRLWWQTVPYMHALQPSHDLEAYNLMSFVHEPFVPVCMKIGLSVFKIWLVETNERTSGRTGTEHHASGSLNWRRYKKFQLLRNTSPDCIVLITSMS